MLRHFVFLLLVAAACSPQPLALKAGLATVPLDAPIGTSLGGYNRGKPASDPGSRWALNFEASTGTLAGPTVRALALDDGLTKVAIVRIDTALVTATLQSRAEAHLGPDVKLLLAATHTHAGPARFFRRAFTQGGGADITSIAMDTYDPELEDRLASSIAEAARQALAQLTPVAVGHGEADGSALNHDRRCQNDALYGEGYRDGTVRIVRFDAVDATGAPVRPLAALLNFAAHGVVMGDGNTLMSSDVTGALESAGGALAGVPLLYLQGAAGDVSPTAGPYEATQALEAWGHAGAPIVKAAFDAAAPRSASARATLQLTVRSVSTKRADCGYAPREYPEFGAVGCGLGNGACEQELDPKTIICLPLAKTGVTSTPVAALRIEDVLLVALPGEPTTAIGARVREAAAGLSGVEQTLVVGYAGDHGGYLLEEPDFLRGGYEPSVSPWGWKFGDHLVRQVREMLSTLGREQPAFVALTPEPVTVHRPVDESAAAPGLLESPPASLERLSTAVLRWSGGDPSLGAPRVTLERDGVEVEAGLLVLRERSSPSFAEAPEATTRAHEYTVQWETVPATELGRYRLVVRGSARRGGETSAYRLESAPFDVVASTAAGGAGSAGIAADGQLAVKVRFAPNPVRFGRPDDPIGNYRLRDPGSTAAEGALARGGSATATLTAPGGATTSVALTWSEAAQALVAPMPQAAGHWAIDLAPRAFTDGAGNTNGAAVRFELNR